jgi:TonB family protein
MFSFADTPLLVKGAVAVVLAVTLAAFLGLVGLRFLRRGAARFWMTPASTALVLLPAVLGAGLTAVLFRQALGAVVLTASGGRAALASGSAEAILPLVFGLPATALLAAFAVLATAIGSGRAESAAREGSKAGHVGALVVAAFAGGLVIVMLGTVASVNSDPGAAKTIAGRLQASVAGSALLLLALCTLGIATAVRAARGPSPASVKLLSLSILSLSGVAALAGVWMAHGQMECLTHTGLTGLPCGVAPAPAAERAPSPREGADLTAQSTSPPQADAGGPEEGAPVRVGGGIKEPRKLKHVSPAYPEIARQARVQGVVILECTIGPDGRITHVTVLRGIPLLDAAAVEAVRQWVYAPTLVNGVPARVIMTVTVNFKLS